MFGRCRGRVYRPGRATECRHTEGNRRGVRGCLGDPGPTSTARSRRPGAARYSAARIRAPAGQRLRARDRARRRTRRATHPSRSASRGYGAGYGVGYRVVSSTSENYRAAEKPRKQKATARTGRAHSWPAYRRLTAFSAITATLSLRDDLLTRSSPKCSQPSLSHPAARPTGRAAASADRLRATSARELVKW